MKERVKAEAVNLNILEETPLEIKKAYQRDMFEEREAPNNLGLYMVEQTLLNHVKNGDYDRLKEELKKFNKSDMSVGHMSNNPLRQAQYMLVSGVTLVTRAAIHGGLSENEAYNLSDIYVQRADKCREEREVISLFVVAILDFTRRVKVVKTRQVFSYSVIKSMSYILDHLHFKITLKELAQECEITPQYLSALFKKDTGITVSKYIMQEKLRVAAQFLEGSEYSIQEIASYLAFSNESSFCLHFKKVFNMTPGSYRKKTKVATVLKY